MSNDPRVEAAILGWRHAAQCGPEQLVALVPNHMRAALAAADAVDPLRQEHNTTLADHALAAARETYVTSPLPQANSSERHLTPTELLPPEKFAHLRWHWLISGDDIVPSGWEPTFHGRWALADGNIFYSASAWEKGYRYHSPCVPLIDKASKMYLSSPQHHERMKRNLK
jgi:hypothetical protein